MPSFEGFQLLVEDLSFKCLCSRLTIVADALRPLLAKVQESGCDLSESPNLEFQTSVLRHLCPPFDRGAGHRAVVPSASPLPKPKPETQLCFEEANLSDLGPQHLSELQGYIMSVLGRLFRQEVYKYCGAVAGTASAVKISAASGDSPGTLLQWWTLW